MRNFELRRSICKFRVSSHHLQIEFGRYQGIPRHQRLCQQCSSGEVEDEVHFLFKCSKYEPDRKELIVIILTSCPNFNSLNDVKKLEWVCNRENHNILTHLGVILREHCRWIFIFFIYLCLFVSVFFFFFSLMSCFFASDTRWNVTAIYAEHLQKHCPLEPVVEQQYISLYIFVYYSTLEFCWGHEVECSMEHVHKHHLLVTLADIQCFIHKSKLIYYPLSTN